MHCVSMCSCQGTCIVYAILCPTVLTYILTLNVQLPRYMHCVCNTVHHSPLSLPYLFSFPLLSFFRSVCRFLLQLSVKRAGGWRDENPPPEPAKPSNFSQDTPTHSANGGKVVQPIPVDTTVGRNGTGPQNEVQNGAGAVGPSAGAVGLSYMYPTSAALSYQTQPLPQAVPPSQPSHFQPNYVPQSVPPEHHMAGVPFNSYQQQTAPDPYQPQPTPQTHGERILNTLLLISSV